MNARHKILILVMCGVAAHNGGTTPALAASGAGGTISIFVEGPDGTIEYKKPFKNAEDFEDIQIGLVRSSLTLAGFGLVEQTIEVVRDPSVAYNLEFTNTTIESQPFIATLQFPINPLSANTISAELLVDLIDANSDGQVSLMGNAGGVDAIQAVTVFGNSIGPPLGMDISTAGMHSFVLNPTAGPMPAGTTLSLNTNFLLSAGDTVHITSRFIIDEGTGIRWAQIQPLPEPGDGPFFNVLDVNSPESSLGNDLSIRAQTQLNLREGGSIGTNFSAGNSTSLVPDIEVNIMGGTMGDDFRVFQESVVNISGGTTADVFMLGSSTANISGGNVGFLRVFSGAANMTGGVTGGFRINDGVLNISGGTVGSAGVQADGGVTTISGGTIGGFSSLRPGGGTIRVSGGTFNGSCGVCASTVGAGSDVTISGGSFTGAPNGLFAFAGSEIVFNIYGGSFSPHIVVREGNELHFFGTEFLLDDVPIEGLVYGEAFEITGRDVTLSGLLADGSPLSFELNSALVGGNDHMSTAARLTVTLILPGDYNDDSVVNAADYVVWRGNLESDISLANDITPWGVGPEDYGVWAANFGRTWSGNGTSSAVDALQPAVPEPASVALLGVGVALIAGTAWHARRHPGFRCL